MCGFADFLMESAPALKQQITPKSTIKNGNIWVAAVASTQSAKLEPKLPREVLFEGLTEVVPTPLET
ncbi:MAG: hypothetical protein ACJAX5_003469 [Patiriisocius sp.]|jgi:hypothetical protein